MSFDDVFLNWLAQYRALTAQEAFHVINHFGKQMPVPPFGQNLQRDDLMVISTTPDAFSDGSSTHPKLPQFGLATAAVWWPARSLRTYPLTQLEEDYGHVRGHPNWIAVFAHAEGYDPPSTRVGLLGVILSLSSPICCRLAIDSAATLSRAERIQSWLALHYSTFSARLPQSDGGHFSNAGERLMGGQGGSHPPAPC